MSKKNNGGPAFPTMYDDGYNMIADGMQARTVAIVKTESGMTLRDWFAGQALPTVVDGALKLLRATEQMPAADKMAHAAYVLADAMLKERAE